MVDVFGDTFGGIDPEKALDLTQAAAGTLFSINSAIPGKFLLDNLFNGLLSNGIDTANVLADVATTGELSDLQRVSTAAGLASSAILAGAFAASIFVPISAVTFAGITGVAAGLSIGAAIVNLIDVGLGLQECLSSPSAPNGHAAAEASSAAIADPLIRSAIADINEAVAELEELKTILDGIDEGYLRTIGILIERGLEQTIGATWLDYDYEYFTDGRIEVYEPGTKTPATNPATNEVFSISVEGILTGLPVSAALNQTLTNTLDLPELQRRNEIYRSFSTSGSQPTYERSLRQAASTLGRASRLLASSTGGSFYALKSSGGSVITRARANSSGSWFARLPEFSSFSVSYFNPKSFLSGSSGFSTGRGGSVLRVSHGINTLEVPGVLTSSSSSASVFNAAENDPDGDGLGPLAEEAIGTRPDLADTDGDGIDDLTEVLQGLDPLGGRGFPTGVIASIDLMGEANEVVVSSEADNESQRTAYVATGSHGMAVVNVSQFNQPIVQGQIELPGETLDVAIASDQKIAVVAAGVEGLHFVDVSDPMLPTLIRTVVTTARQVEIARGVVYSTNGDRVESYELLSGFGLTSIDIDTGTITGMAIEHDTLFTMDSNHNLTAVDISDAQMTRFGNSGSPVTLPDGGGKLFVSEGIAYAVARTNSLGGFATADVSDPDAITVLSGSDVAGNNRAPRNAIVTNGAGKAIVVGDTFASDLISLLDVTDPNDTADNIVGFNLPAKPLSVFVASGIAFVGDEDGGFSVVNYLPFDNQGIAPTISIAATAEDLDPDTPGIQISEGTKLPLFVTAGDDFMAGDGLGQIRNVELIVNGEIVDSDVAAPFDLQTFAPAIAIGGESLSIQVRAWDTGGNATLSNELTYQIEGDSVGPELVGNSIGADAIGFNLDAVILSFSEAINREFVDVNSISIQNVDSSEEIALENATVTAERQLTVLARAPLPTGRYRLSIAAEAVVDSAGNAAREDVVFDFINVREIADSIQWIAGDGDWSNPNNWSTRSVPGRFDNVIVDVPGNDVTVTISGGSHATDDLMMSGSLNITGGSLTVHGTGSVDGAVNVGNASLSVTGNTSSFIANALTTIDSASLFANAGGQLLLPNVETYSNSVDDVWRSEGPGSLIRLENLQRITNGTGNNHDFTINARIGGKIELPDVTDIIDPTGGDTRSRQVIITADGVGSEIDLRSLVNYTDANTDQRSTLTAINGGTLNVESLSNLNRIAISLNGTGTMPVSQITDFTSGSASLSGTNYAFSSLVNAAGTNWSINGIHTDLSQVTSIASGSVTLQSGGTVDLERASNIDGSRFSVAGGVTLSLPAATSYSNSIDDSFVSVGTGSVLDLSGLTSITNGTGNNYDLTISAQAGGKIDLSGTLQIIDPSGGDTRSRQVIITANGVGSEIDLRSLVNYSDANTDQRSTLTAVNGGVLNVESLTDLNRIAISLNGTGTMPISQIINFTSGSASLSGTDYVFESLINASGTGWGVNGVHADLSQVTSIASGAVTLQGGGTVDLSRASNIDGSSLSVSGGVTLALPAATSYSNSIDDSLVAVGTGSVLDLSGLTSITNGTGNNYDLTISAQSGGKIDLSGTLQIIDPSGGDTRSRQVIITANGVGSEIDLRSLVNYSDANTDQRSTLTAVNGGHLNVESLTDLNRIAVTLNGTGTMPISQIINFTSGSASLSGTDYVFDSLVNAAGTGWAINAVHTDLAQVTSIASGAVTLENGGTVNLERASNIDGSRFNVSGGVTLSLPVATSYSNSIDDSFIVSGNGSLLDLSALTSITNGTGNNYDLTISAQSGGKIDLSGTLQIIDPSGGDTRSRQVIITADGVGSEIDLQSLLNYSDANADQRSTLTAINGGRVIASLAGIATIRVDINVGTGSQISGSLELSAGSRLLGSGLVTGNVRNGGVFSPGRTFEIGGDYEQTFAGTLNIDLAGTEEGEFDVLTIGGTAILAGTLNTVLTGGFAPAASDPPIAFALYSSSSGTFDTLSISTYSLMLEAMAATLFVD